MTRKQQIVPGRNSRKHLYDADLVWQYVLGNLTSQGRLATGLSTLLGLRRLCVRLVARL